MTNRSTGTSRPTLALAAHVDGYLKVKLFYLTWEARHLRSQVLESDFHAEPPFTEDVSVLMPPEEVFLRLQSFEPIFALLKEDGVLYTRDRLRSFEFREEDTRTLAYYSIAAIPVR